MTTEGWLSDRQRTAIGRSSLSMPARQALLTARVAALLAAEGVQVTVASAFGTEQLPTGLRVLIGQRTA